MNDANRRLKVSGIALTVFWQRARFLIKRIGFRFPLALVILLPLTSNATWFGALRANGSLFGLPSLLTDSVIASIFVLASAVHGAQFFSEKRLSTRRQRSYYSRPELLENRVLLSAASWTSPTSGSWQTAANWSTGAVPKAGDDVVINEAGGIQVTLNGSASVNSITLTGDTLNVAIGSLTVAGAVTNNSGSITVSPGTSLNVGGQYTQNATGTLTLPSGTSGAGVGTNLLTNAGFESPTASNSTTSPNVWGTWGTSYMSTQFAETGNQSLRTYGPNSGVIESYSATPGVSYTGSVYAMTPSTNPLTGPEGAFLEVMFFDSKGNHISPYAAPNDITILDSTSKSGGPVKGSVGSQGWNYFTTSAVAPSNAATVSFILDTGAYTGRSGTAGGDVYWDNAAFGPTALNFAKVTAANINNNGMITVGAGDSVKTSGAFSQTATGVLDVQLGAPPASGDFGSVSVGTTANLGGKLQADLVNGYAPTIGDGFNVITYTAATGSFTTNQLPSSTAYQFAAAFNPTYLGIGAVPTSVTTSINASAPAQTLSTNLLGVNLAYWDDKLTTSQTQQMVQAAGLDAFRFPGGSASDDYHFNVASNYGDTAANTIPNFVQFIQQVNGVGIVTLDYGSGSPQEAAAELAYLKGSPTDKTVIGSGIEWNDTTGQWQTVNWQTVGYWASLRAAAPLATNDGLNFMRISHPATFTGVNYWEVGNEEYGSWEVDHHGTAGPGGVSTGAQHDPATYAAFAHSFATFAAEIDPTISIGIDSGDPTGGSDINWTKNVLTAGVKIGFVPGFISDHSYMQGPGSESDSFLLQTTVSNPSSILDWSTRHADYESMLQQTVGIQSSSVLVMATEFNSVYTNPGKQSTSLVNGLFVADSLGSLIDSGYSGGFVWDLRNGWDPNQNNSSSLFGWRQGGDYGLLGDPNTSLPPSTGPYVAYPSYYAEQLASKMIQSGSQVVSATTNYQGLSTYAVKEPNGDLEILVINKNPDAALTDQISLQGFQPSGAAQVWQYGEVQDHAQSLSTTGAASLANSSITLSVVNKSLTYSFPAYSMTVLDLSPTVTVNKLVFTQAPPAAGTAGTALSPTIKVSVEDSQGSVVTTDSSTVTLTIGTVTYTATASKGVATFNISNLSITKSGSYTWTASDGTDTKVTSGLVIKPAAANLLEFTSVPATGHVNVALTSPVTVAIVDAFGNIVMTDSSAVTLVLASAPAGGTISNRTSVTVNAVNGVATFNGMKFTKAGTYKLKVTDGTLTAAVSGKIVIS